MTEITKQQKRGQIQQVFSFILIGIVIVATIYLSLRFFGVLQSSTCDAQTNKISSVLHEIEESYDTRGTRQTVEVSVACNAQALCFFPMQSSEAYSAASVSQTLAGVGYQLLSVAEASQENRPNAYLVVENTIVELGVFPKITSENIHCVPSQNGRFLLHVEGTGRQAKIT